MMLELDNLKPDREQIAHQQEQLALYRRRLAYQIQQQAQLGVIAPFSLVEDISKARDEIQRLKEQLRAWGVSIDDWPDDRSAQPSVAPMHASEQAGAGLAAMADLLGAPDVRMAVEGFRESFELVCLQIDRLSHHKDLHDLLHNLEFNCYNPIIRGARDFPSNALFLESLADYAAELQEIVNNLWEVIERGSLSASEQAWIYQIGQTSDLLRDAIEQTSKELLDRATFRIGRVLYIHPSRINERLKEAARDLPLTSLIKAMRAVQQHSMSTTPTSEKLDQLSRGIAALEQLNQGLILLIEEHDRWQEIDLELHRVDESLESHARELEWLWPDLSAGLTLLCQGRGDRWTEDLRQACNRLELALNEQKPTAIAVAFRSVRRQVGLCFFQADKRLKELCRTLRRVDGPLNSVISIVA
jgi:hypothetical protein